MEESRSSQRPKGDLSFQLFPKDATGRSQILGLFGTGHARILQIQDDLRVSRKPPRQPKGHPKVAENPRKLSAAQLEKRQPNGLKVCSIWWARRASSLPRRRNHKKECLLLIRVSTFHIFEHQPTCLCTTLAFLN